MAKSDLLKEAIADANAVRETALANAKIALEEAFTPRLERMLSAKLAEELEEEEMPEDGMGEDEMDMGMEDDSMDMDAPDGDVMNVSIDDPSTPASPDFTGDIPKAGGDMEADMAMDAPAEDGMDDLDLESIIRELEGMDNEMDAEDAHVDGMHEEEESMDEMRGKKNKSMRNEMDMEADSMGMDEDIDAIIEAILGESDDIMNADDDEMMKEEEVAAEELEEAYSTIKQLQSVLQEVNLLNAKLLYTNKLFRNFELSENQKMKVIENFDRAANTREVKLVFSTIAESLARPATKKVVKEHKNVASKATRSTKPSKGIISEGNEMAARFKKLAGLS